MDNSTLLSLIIGVVLGATFSWLITHIYYKKSNHSQQILFDKLTSDVKTAIIQSDKNSIGSEQLKELLSNITIDGGTIDGGNF